MDVPSPKPQFIRVLLSEFMQKLWIPRKIEQHIGILVNRKATLHSPLGKLWYIKIEQDEDDADGRLYFGEGWKEFAEAHELRLGYTMVFCYEGGTVFTFKVFDLTTCLKVYSPTISDLKKRLKKKKEKKKKKNEVIKFKSRSFTMKNPHHLERVIMPCHVTYMYLDIHKGFCEMNGLVPGNDVVLRDPEGRTWRVRICKGGVGWYKIGMGWRNFFRMNKLKVGDKCAFEVMSVSGQTVLLVRICRECE